VALVHAPEKIDENSTDEDRERGRKKRVLETEEGRGESGGV
jgi:hypothetical protein